MVPAGKRREIYGLCSVISKKLRRSGDKRVLERIEAPHRSSRCRARNSHPASDNT
jgi:hypothetical protein